MSDECQELKNIKYQTMLLTGSDKIKEPLQNVKSDSINSFLEKETISNKKESWNKLNKTTKIKLLYEYAETISISHLLNNRFTLKVQITDIIPTAFCPPPI